MSTIEIEKPPHTPSVKNNLVNRLGRVNDIIPSPLKNFGFRTISAGYDLLLNLGLPLEGRITESYRNLNFFTDVLVRYMKRNHAILDSDTWTDIYNLPSYINSNLLQDYSETLKILRSPGSAESSPGRCIKLIINPDLQGIIDDKNQGLIISVLHGFDIHAMYSIKEIFGERKIYLFMEQQPESLQALLTKKMVTVGIIPIFIDMSKKIDHHIMKEVIHEVKKGAVLITHIDRPPRIENGMVVDFFEEQAFIDKNVLVDLSRYAPVVPAITGKTDDNQYTIHIGKVFDALPKQASRDLQEIEEKKLAQHLIKEFERLIIYQLIHHGAKNFSVFSFNEPLFVKQRRDLLEDYGKGLLHNHTTHSDAPTTPEELIAALDILGVNVIAFTDHDKSNSLPANADLTKYIQGVEVTFDSLPGSHLVVLFSDRAKAFDVPMFLGFEETIQFVFQRDPDAIIYLPHPQFDLGFLLNPRRFLSQVRYVAQPARFSLAKKLIDRTLRENSDLTFKYVYEGDTHYPPPYGNWDLAVAFPGKNAQDLLEAFREGTVVPVILKDFQHQRLKASMVIKQMYKALIEQSVPMLKSYLNSRHKKNV